jgi:hypothetical protein
MNREHYRDYVGQFVKRFYAPFKEENIYKIKDFRTKEVDDLLNPGTTFQIAEYLYDDGIHDPWWTDCEDSCIITNEMPIKEIDWVANVNSLDYKGFNPFKP